MDIAVTRVDALRVYAISSGPAPIPHDQVLPVVYRLFDWVHQHGGHSAGYLREVHLQAEPLPEEQWVTRLELPFE